MTETTFTGGVSCIVTPCMTQILFKHQYLKFNTLVQKLYSVFSWHRHFISCQQLEVYFSQLMDEANCQQTQRSIEMQKAVVEVYLQKYDPGQTKFLVLSNRHSSRKIMSTLGHRFGDIPLEMAPGSCIVRSSSFYKLYIEVNQCLLE